MDHDGYDRTTSPLMIARATASRAERNWHTAIERARKASVEHQAADLALDARQADYAHAVEQLRRLEAPATVPDGIAVP